MLHHYMQRGFKPAYIINLPVAEKLFFKASMELFLEEENARWEAAADVKI